MAGKSWQQEYRAAGHTASQSKDAERNDCSARFSPSADAWVLSTFTVGLSCSIKPFQKHPHRHSQRCASVATPNSRKLVTKINFHATARAQWLTVLTQSSIKSIRTETYSVHSLRGRSPALLDW